MTISKIICIGLTNIAASRVTSRFLYRVIPARRERMFVPQRAYLSSPDFDLDLLPDFDRSYSSPMAMPIFDLVESVKSGMDLSEFLSLNDDRLLALNDYLSKSELAKDIKDAILKHYRELPVETAMKVLIHFERHALRKLIELTGLGKLLELKGTSDCDFKQDHCDLKPKPSTIQFSLLDHNNGVFSESRLRGKFFVVYFGYLRYNTNFRDALCRLSQVKDYQKEFDKEIFTLFITLDPERDRPSTLKSVLKVFSDNIVGLTGPNVRIQNLKNALHKAAFSNADTFVDATEIIFMENPKHQVKPINIHSQWFRLEVVEELQLYDMRN